MEIRIAAVQATLDRFKDRLFSYGSVDCARMVAYHLKQLGYKPGLARGGPYKTAKGAVAALKRAGFDTIEDALDSLGLIRIPPAYAIAGDIAKVEAGEGLIPALVIYLGNGRIMGFFHQTRTVMVMQPEEATHGAWRVNPRGMI